MAHIDLSRARARKRRLGVQRVPRPDRNGLFVPPGLPLLGPVGIVGLLRWRWSNLPSTWRRSRRHWPRRTPYPCIQTKEQNVRVTLQYDSAEYEDAQQEGVEDSQARQIFSFPLPVKGVLLYGLVAFITSIASKVGLRVVVLSELVCRRTPPHANKGASSQDLNSWAPFSPFLVEKRRTEILIRRAGAARGA